MQTTPLLMGLIEGLTEFLPVSSTGHLILAGHLLDFHPPGGVFEVAIQLGAILAICVLYLRRLSAIVVGLPRQPEARRFTAAVLLGFLPAAMVGVLAHDVIKTVLFSPLVVSWALIGGGIAIIVIERSVPMVRFRSVEGFPATTALAIGGFQCLAMVPGVSRSGATIMGALMMGVDRKTAAEYSFFLAIPTMFGAVTYDVWKSRHLLVTDDLTVIAVGTISAFITALLVVQWLVGFVGRNGFSAFGYYRIAVGAVMLMTLT